MVDFIGFFDFFKISGRKNTIFFYKIHSLEHLLFHYFCTVKLATFNPDHDLALAHGRTHYVPPASAAAFAADAAPIVAWLTRDAAVLVPYGQPADDFADVMHRLGIECQWITEKELPLAEVGEVLPWGWNYNLRERLKKMGIVAEVLPNDTELAEIQRLSHRRTAAEAMKFLRERVARPDLLPLPAQELHTLEEADALLVRYGKAMFKMPWSGSGRGLRRVEQTMSPHQRGWIRQSILKSGCIMAEPFMSVVQDFAMEFYCNGKVSFEGYSLFKTHNGVYLGNILASDAVIEKRLSQWVDIQLLHEYRDGLLQFIQNEIAPYYKGCVGVDMFVYQKDGAYLVNPAVELNLRMTMGLLANRFCQNYLADGVTGTMSLEYRATAGELYVEHLALNEKFPPVMTDGKLVNGSITLSPVWPETCYTVRVKVTSC